MRLQLFKANKLKYVRVRRLQVHSQRNAGHQCLLPTSHAKAPPVALLQAGKVGTRCDEVVKSARAPPNNIGSLQEARDASTISFETQKLAKERLSSSDFDWIYRQKL